MKSFFVLVLATVLLILAGSAHAQQIERDRGIELYRDGKFVEAAALLERSVDATEKDRDAWTFLAGSYVHVGERIKAAHAFEKANARSTSPQPKYEKSVKIIFRPRAEYTQQARRNMSSGRLRVAVEFRADATIGFIFPLPTIVHQDLIKQSVDAAKGIRFEPAVKDGKPVTVIKMVEYRFSVQ